MRDWLVQSSGGCARAGAAPQQPSGNPLARGAAHGTLGKPRPHLPVHERAGLALESMFAEQLEDHLDELAHHYSRSDNVSKAVEYLERAGQQALKRSAYADAIRSLSASIDLLQKLPDGPERIRREL